MNTPNPETLRMLDPAQYQHERCEDCDMRIPEGEVVTLDGSVLCAEHGMELAWEICSKPGGNRKLETDACRVVIAGLIRRVTELGRSE